MSGFDIRDFFKAVMQLGAKHNHYKDFGWPEQVGFSHLHKMYERNDMASAAVRKTTEKTFQSLPAIMVGESDDEEFTAAADRLGLWDTIADIDEYAQVSGYSGLILRIADGRQPHEPVDGVTGLDALIEVIPAWSEQLQVESWHEDSKDPDMFGKPKAFTYNEAALSQVGTNRSYKIHPDRVFIWSSDGTVHARSALLSGYNNLLDMEKISGAGGEGFWKTAAARLNIEIDKDTDFADFQKSVEASTGKTLQDALDEKAKKLNAGFDSSYISQGMKVAPFSISLPQPRQFFDIPLQAFAAGRSMPVKIMIGMQTGERASKEDAQEWNNTIRSRRNRWVIPSIRGLLAKLVAIGILDDADRIVEWDDLSNDTPNERIARGKDMAGINATQITADGQLVFTAEEIRDEAGYDSDGAPEEMEFDDE